ncbi:hypothetical protein HCB17_20400 [Salinispora arenicola]|uniref:hypothetical protein n=1 Tax=Salinispora arenicola TaxID=168697 RepID=UPI00142FA1D2|nr:hypothetical protein [Salinispora arenicola]NIL43234.1 hypothetical protein [Salinispora arenicola]
MANRRVGVVLVAAVVVMLAMAGCLGKDKALQPTETSAQAAERLEELLREAFAQLPSDVTVDRRLRVNAVPCDAPSDGGPEGRVFAERNAEIIPPASGAWSVTVVLPILSEFWEQKGYKVITDERFGNQHRYTVQLADGYRLFIRTYDRDGSYDVAVGASSPCVWEFGTPDPQ